MAEVLKEIFLKYYYFKKLINEYMKTNARIACENVTKTLISFIDSIYPCEGEDSCRKDVEIR